MTKAINFLVWLLIMGISGLWLLVCGQCAAWLVQLSTSLVVDCTGAPAQYKEAKHWIDAARSVRCAEYGEKGKTNNLYYSDAQIR